MVSVPYEPIYTEVGAYLLQENPKTVYGIPLPRCYPLVLKWPYSERVFSQSLELLKHGV